MKQLAGLNQKDIIPKVTGKITKLWEPKEKEGNYGKYTIQSGEIEIDGDLYGLTFWDCPQNIDVMKGQMVTIFSKKGKMGLGGVELDHESYTTKTGEKVDRDSIRVKKTAGVTLADSEQTQSQSPQVVQKQSIVPDTDPGAALEDIVKTHLYVDSLVRLAYKEKAYDEETLRSYVSSVFIEANRKGICIKAQTPAVAAYDPADWASAIVPSGSQKGKKLGEIGKPALTKLYAYYLDKGFNSDFARCVEQAGKDLQLDEAGDDLPDLEW
jgi:hypothetical protein